MSNELPENFASEEELAEWFENADLSQYRLDEALDVVVATHVSLSVEGAAESEAAEVAGQTGTTGSLHLVRS